MKKKSARARFRPDAGDSTPLYLQFARHLGESIREGRYQPHEALPSERLLSETLGLSRVTTRKAIGELVHQGLIVRRQGSGNYIAPHLEQPLSHLTSFSEELHARGYTPGSRWLSRAITTASHEERRYLGLAANARVARLKRLRLADDVVMAYEEAVLPASVLPDPEAVGSSLYEHLAAIRKAPTRAVQHFRAVNAPARLARQMGLPAGHAVLFITRIAYLDTGQAVEVTYSYCRSDYYDFVAEMRREA
jgi:GntR family transcriptional regulator